MVQSLKLRNEDFSLRHAYSQLASLLCPNRPTSPGCTKYLQWLYIHSSKWLKDDGEVSWSRGSDFRMKEKVTLTSIPKGRLNVVG
jgi:hypothetical protein